MSDEQISKQKHKQQFQNFLSEINNVYSWGQLIWKFAILGKNVLTTEEAKQILNALEKIGIDFDKYLSLYFFLDCRKESLDAECVKMFLNKFKSLLFDDYLLTQFLNACGENSLDGENLKNLYRVCYGSVFKGDNRCKISSELNKTSKKLFQNLCRFHDEREKESLKKELPERKAKNKKLGILGGIGITFGGLLSFGAIGLGAAIGVGALAVTIFAPIAAAFAVVSLLLIGIFGYLTDKFRVNKELNKIVEAKLNEKVVDKKEIPFDLRNRKEIQNALDESKAPLLQNVEDEITQ